MYRPLLLAAFATLCACAQEARHAESIRLIVRWETEQKPTDSHLRALERALGARVRYVREMSGGAHVLGVVDTIDTGIDAALQRVSALPDVRYAVRDARRMRH